MISSESFVILIPTLMNLSKELLNLSSEVSSAFKTKSMTFVSIMEVVNVFLI